MIRLANIHKGVIMKRHEVLKLGGLGISDDPLADTRLALGQQAKEAQTHVLRIYADEEGNSHLKELSVATTASGKNREALTVAATGLKIRE